MKGVYFMTTDIYGSIWFLINDYIFGGIQLAAGTAEYLTCTLLATCASVFVFALPFMIVWKVAKLILGE